MKLKLEFDCDNAAFDDANMQSESARILRSVADSVAEGWLYGQCKDINGNTIGKWSLKNDSDND